MSIGLEGVPGEAGRKIPGIRRVPGTRRRPHPVEPSIILGTFTRNLENGAAIV